MLQCRGTASVNFRVRSRIYLSIAVPRMGIAIAWRRGTASVDFRVISHNCRMPCPYPWTWYCLYNGRRSRDRILSPAAICTTSRVYKKKTFMRGFPYSKIKLLTEFKAIAPDKCYNVGARHQLIFGSDRAFISCRAPDGYCDRMAPGHGRALIFRCDRIIVGCRAPTLGRGIVNITEGDRAGQMLHNM